MGRAFTEDERAAVKEKLRRNGLKLLARDGIKGISIRELTKLSGIAQGGFYTFYKDKYDFVVDLVTLRVIEKTKIMYDNREKTKADPQKFIVELLYNEGMHLKNNKAFDNTVNDTLSLWNVTDRSDIDRIYRIYRSFLQDMISYWEQEGYRITCDIEGILQSGRAAGFLFMNASLMNEDYFPEIYMTFCEAEVNRFFKAEKS
jgi:AcrR family transcriptional regulator